MSDTALSGSGTVHFGVCQASTSDTTEENPMRTRNPRVELLGHLDNMYRGLKWVREHWKAEGRSTVFDSSPDMFNNPWRSRRPDEYPEAQPEEWKQVIDEMEALEQAALTVRLFAAEQLDKTMTNRVRASTSEERRDV